MKCTKIVLNHRPATSGPKEILRNHDKAVWVTSGYHGYSYKLSARAKQYSTPRSPAEPQLTITTLIFPENKNFNTGSSLDRWSRKTPTLVTSKQRNHTPRRNMLDDEYDFYYPDIFSDNKGDEYSVYDPELFENNFEGFDFNDYFVASDIEELVLKSQRAMEERSEQRKSGKKRKSKKKDSAQNDKKESAKSKRNKFKKTIRFSLSKPPSPETEQVIRVDVTSNVSFDDTAEIEEVIKGHPSLAINKEYYKKDFKSNKKEASEKPFDSNNNERDDNLGNEGVEEDFVVKCRQLALTKKKR